MVAAGVGLGAGGLSSFCCQLTAQQAGLRGELGCQLPEMEEGPAWDWLRRGWIKTVTHARKIIGDQGA